MNTYGKIMTLVVLLLILSFIAFQAGQYFGIFPSICPANAPVSMITTTPMVLDTQIIEEHLKEIAQLSTASYYVEMITTTESNKLINLIVLPPIELPFNIGKKNFTLEIKGEIKAGFDLTDSQIKIDADQEKKLLTLTFPEPVILDSIHDDQIQILDDKGALFNPANPQDYKDAVAAVQKDINQRAENKDLLGEAKTNLETLINDYSEIFQKAYQLEGYTININYE